MNVFAPISGSTLPISLYLHRQSSLCDNVQRKSRVDVGETVLDLHTDLCAHGQLCTALSRVRGQRNSSAFLGRTTRDNGKRSVRTSVIINQCATVQR